MTMTIPDPSRDLAGVRASLSALQQAIDQTEALRRDFLATRRRAEDLIGQLADAANAASPYVLFFPALVRSGTSPAGIYSNGDRRVPECTAGVSRQLPRARSLPLRYHDLQLRYNEAVSEFQDRISTLEAQLAAASSFGVIVPPDTARRLANLASQLARSHSDLQVARDRQCNGLATCPLLRLTR
ncbi:hypothetical protein F441_11252 [Phytophthora nicotianae CJ01A1]|uniref:Uncharacterized protein n=1 Tax=Phytophthora nicotianae CJ01A1 TaxID=1317063 RepID=W2WT17_PHYNI|nr:hypothetical protein F441_11252 [Phytophthora nicotianae CJ01A1]